jgi:hypothetical protein
MVSDGVTMVSDGVTMVCRMVYTMVYTPTRSLFSRYFGRNEHCAGTLLTGNSRSYGGEAPHDS